MHDAPQSGHHESQAVPLPIRPMPAVFMVVALSLVLLLDGCVRNAFSETAGLPGCGPALTGLMDWAHTTW